MPRVAWASSELRSMRRPYCSCYLCGGQVMVGSRARRGAGREWSASASRPHPARDPALAVTICRLGAVHHGGVSRIGVRGYHRRGGTLYLRGGVVQTGVVGPVCLGRDGEHPPRYI